MIQILQNSLTNDNDTITNSAWFDAMFYRNIKHYSYKFTFAKIALLNKSISANVNRTHQISIYLRIN